MCFESSNAINKCLPKCNGDSNQKLYIKLTWHILAYIVCNHSAQYSEMRNFSWRNQKIFSSNGQLDHDDAVRGVVGLTPDIKFSENAMVPMPSAHLTLLLTQCSKNGIILWWFHEIPPQTPNSIFLKNFLHSAERSTCTCLCK